MQEGRRHGFTRQQQPVRIRRTHADMFAIAFDDAVDLYALSCVCGKEERQA